MLPPAWTSQYVGIPFMDLGRDPMIGLDCWGLALLVLERHFGIKGLPDFGDRYERATDRSLVEVFSEELRNWRRLDPPAPGDIAVFRIFGRPMHVAIFVGDGWLLSVEKGVDSHLDRVDSLRWRGRLDGYYRRG